MIVSQKMSKLKLNKKIINKNNKINSLNLQIKYNNNLFCKLKLLNNKLISLLKRAINITFLMIYCKMIKNKRN